jgi:hypothetical protein
MFKVLVRPNTLLADGTCPQTRIRTRTVHRREPVCRLSLIAARRKTGPDDPRTVTAEDPLTGATFKASSGPEPPCHADAVGRQGGRAQPRARKC